MSANLPKTWHTYALKQEKDFRKVKAPETCPWFEYR
jgi:hypothetical protein